MVRVLSSKKCRILEEDGPQEVHQPQKPNLAEPFFQIVGILPDAGEAFLYLREHSLLQRGWGLDGIPGVEVGAFQWMARHGAHEYPGHVREIRYVEGVTIGPF